MAITNSNPSAWVITTVYDAPPPLDDSNPSAWIIAIVDAAPSTYTRDSPASLWITASIDNQPNAYDADSDPTGWLITTIATAGSFTADSDPTLWVITTIDTTAPLSGMFLVIAGGTLVPLELDLAGSVSNPLVPLVTSTSLLTSPTLVTQG